ncbi:hypothetical protein [Microbulbifer sp. DLAB2-AA]|uniref:hypothetical protein n=1 Tax=Microbulbifer sp. DLAB2-AA TaxID=3243394 RepID=UPI00403A6EA4
MVKSLSTVVLEILILFAMKQWMLSKDKQEKLARLNAIETAEQCIAVGGELRPVCMSGTRMCIVNYSDAGKSCLSSSQCQGECRVSESKAGNVFAMGQCSTSNNPCGCWANVELGMVNHAICFD